MKILKEFKEFAVKGNVIDLAVAVIIGGAFGKIVNSLVADVVMPVVGIIIGGVDFSSLTLGLRGDAVLPYGRFLQSVVDFLIIGWVIFLAIKAINRFKSKQEEKEAEEKPKEPSEEVKLLSEIRDLLKK
jgi:large conductance mechanosensitive channel